MNQSSVERCLIVFFRLAMGWTFLYAASHQVFVPGWSVAGFLNNTKTFHDLFAYFATPTMAPITSFFVSYGHLLIGVSLILGLMTRVSAGFGILLMVVYWMAHMNFPYIENRNNFILDFHIVYAGVLTYLIVKHAGHVWGLDGWVERLPFFDRHPGLRPLVA
jgi:thiosulfate dehydrogenase [quinone] large subunit